MSDRKRSVHHGQSSRRPEKWHTPSDTRSAPHYHGSQGSSSKRAQKPPAGYSVYESTGSHDYNTTAQSSSGQNGLENASFPPSDGYGDQYGDQYGNQYDGHHGRGGTVAPDYPSHGLDPLPAGCYQADTDDQGQGAAGFDDDLSMGVNQGSDTSISPTSSFNEQLTSDNTVYTSQIGKESKPGRQRKKKVDGKNAKTDRGRSSRSVENWMQDKDQRWSGQTPEELKCFLPDVKYTTTPSYPPYVEESDLQEIPSMMDPQPMYPPSYSPKDYTEDSEGMQYSGEYDSGY